MSRIFIWILNQSTNAVYLMFAVLVVRQFIKKAPKWMSCALWGLVALKLVMPFSFESAMSLVPSREPIPQNIEYVENPRIDTGISVINGTVNPLIENNLSPEPVPNSMNANPMQVVMTVGAYVWTTGILLMLAYFCVSWLVMKRRVAAFRQFRDNVYISDCAGSPFIFGIVRPRIYIPAGLADEQLDCVLEHEMSHIKRLDYLWKPLGYLILAVYWFNPLCWISYILLCKDIELACDEKVTRDKDKEWKAMYCQTLLDCASGGRKQRGIITACPIAFGEASIKDRVKSVLHYKKPAFWIIIAALAAGAAAAVCFATSPAWGRLREIEGYALKQEEYSSIGIFDGEELVTVDRDSSGSAVLEEIFEIKISPSPIDRSRSEERGKPHGIFLSREAGGRTGTAICFNDDFTQVWAEDEGKPTFAYRVTEPEKLGELYRSLLQQAASLAPPVLAAQGTGRLEEGISDVLKGQAATASLADEGYAIRLAVLSHNRRAEGTTGIYSCASFIILDKEFDETFQGRDSGRFTYYGWALYEEYMPSGIRLGNVSGRYVPAVLSFDISQNGEYQLAEYWEPRDGSSFVSDIKEKVPAKIYEDMIDSRKFILRQKQDCYAQMVEACGLDPNMAMAELLDMVIEGPEGSSDPQDYIDAHLSEYSEMTYYGLHALEYCFSRFEKGGEAGLEGQVMERVCADICYSLGETAVWDIAKFKTGQEWYDDIRTRAEELRERYAPSEIAEKYPASYLLLELLGEL